MTQVLYPKNQIDNGAVSTLWMMLLVVVFEHLYPGLSLVPPNLDAKMF